MTEPENFAKLCAAYYCKRRADENKVFYKGKILSSEDLKVFLVNITGECSQDTLSSFFRLGKGVKKIK